MDGLLFTDVKRVRVKRRVLLRERYSMGHQSIFTSNFASALESKRDVIHILRYTGGGQTLSHVSFGVFNTHKSSLSTLTLVLLNIHAFILYVTSCNLPQNTCAVNNNKKK
jgi:hypothetical protein